MPRTVRPLLFLFLLPLLLCVAACNGEKKSVQQTLERIMESEVSLPAEIEEICGGEGYMLPDSVRTAEKLLYFVDSLQCSTCQISKFVRFGEIMRKADSTGRFELMFLVSPKKGEKEFIRDYIKSIEMPFPICVDLDNAFRRINPAIPDDVRFHCLYLDAEGRPLLAGDPTVSENISALLDKIIFNNPTNNQSL